MGRVIHFEICTKDLERASDFYRKVFNWEIQGWGGPQKYFLATTGESSEPGINGGLMETDEKDFQGTINTIAVDNLETMMEKVKISGGEVIRQKMVIPGIGYHTYCRDTEGNIFGILQEDKEAKP